MADLLSFPVLVMVYAGLNILAFAVFTSDKLKAGMRMRRTSENLLLFTAAAGPCGALISMGLFRHKIRDVKFFLVPVFLILHILLVVRFLPWVP